MATKMDEERRIEENKIAEKWKEASVESYREECRRADVLFTKSDALMRYIMAMFVYINALLSIYITASSNGIVSIEPIWLLMYIVVSITFMVSAIFCMIAQHPRDRRALPDGKEIGKQNNPRFTENNVYVGKEASYTMDTMKYYSGARDDLNTNNNEMSDSLKKAQCAFRAGIIILTLSMCGFVLTLL